MDWGKLLTEVLIAVITLAVSVILYYLRQWISAKIGADKLKLLQEVADVVVDGVEQSSVWDELLSTGRAKKERAVHLVDQWLRKHGLVLDLGAIGAAVEASVLNMNRLPSLRYALDDDPEAEDMAVDDIDDDYVTLKDGKPITLGPAEWPAVAVVGGQWSSPDATGSAGLSDDLPI